ncbi:Set3 complex subunit with deacetylase activity, meiotic-specific repressor of sporulation proteins [Pestalotiopsis sp. 9143b]|nr:Set3 complex subunit with deacetylase activity, meiotic-specific repressor of sporulation proteins [Pestalotiopsis sp. 9143b]
MDAQNAVESTSAKQPASPRRAPDNESTLPRNRSPVASKTAASSTTTTSVPKDPKPPPNSTSNAADDDAAQLDSDAETIVLPGKDGISPSKPRKVIKHEDKSDGEIDDHVLPAPKKPSRDAKESPSCGERPAAADDSASSVRQKKRPLEKQRPRDGSAGLSSAPTSPPSHLPREQSSSHRRRTHGNHDSGSDSETPKPRSPKLPKEKATPSDRHLTHKRKAPKTESDDDVESRKIRRPRVSEAGLESRHSKDSKSLSSKPHLDRHSSSRPRSISPHVRAHRRSLSTQLPDKSYASGLGTKKRRIPAPLQSMDYHSDDSSASGSPHPRSSRLKSIVTPGTGDSTMSPAKLAPHKKHLDAHGQTLFAKACAKGEYDVAKTRLAERPEDLNFADHAGNTPLQVASLNGHEDVVELLIGAGCNLECRNDVKDTPLLDAVENGHFGVVKLLLAAGVNPRKANAEGQEPLEKVPDDLDNAEEIRQALREARQKVGELRRTSEDHLPQDNQDTSSHGANSPRRSPEPSLGAVLAASSRRGGTVRSTKTSNHLLYMSLDEKTLRQAAARGDHETVTRVLQVKESCDDAEALVAAARGGHNFVMELLLALGGANPDPSPVSSLPGEHSTPMLAAIGQENIKVVQLLLEQSGFDPTRRFRGETYYEIARRREGPMWKEEEHMLKNAYDEYKKTHKGHSKNKVSPSRREREAGHESKRSARAEPNIEKARSQHKRRPSSPPRDGEVKKKVNSGKTATSPKEKKRSQSFGQNDEQASPKRGRPKKEDKVPTIAISDREASPALSAKAHPVKPKRSESDMAGSSEGETAKPRRKLISGKDLKGQRDKQRRSSMVSNNSTKDATEKPDSKADDSTEKPRAERITEKYHDRTKALKRDDSRDRLSPNDSSAKRHRASMTPPRHGADEKDDNEAPVKRRKLDAEGKENRALKASSAEDRPRKRDSSGEPIKRQKLPDGERKDVLKAKKLNRERKESEKVHAEKSESTAASEDVDMRDAPEISPTEDRETASDKERVESRKRQAELEAAEEEARKKSEAIKQRELEERQKREADEKRLQEEADKKRAEEEKRRLEEAEKKRQEEAQAKLEAERQKREAEERKAREEEERLQKEKEDQKRRQEEERIRLEKEAAEEARRLREEEERRERERKRAARDAELLRQRQEQEREQERIRLSKLPPLLRWLDGCADPKQREYAQLFTIMQGVRYDTINPQATGAQGREQWLLNTQVALLLGEKDLSLQRYTGWERIPVSNIAKRVIWRLEQDRYALTESKLYHLGEQLPDYYGGDPGKVGYQRLEKLRRDASKLFFDMDMFFVKESDLLFVLPSIPHLRNVKLSICYRELPEHETELNSWTAPAKWKSDPDANAREGFAPRQKYYINGRLNGEDRPGHYKPSASPFPDQRVPRRGGLVAVSPEEPDYPQLCLEQGLGHLLSEHQKLSAMNAAHLTPRSMTSNDTADGPNGDNMSPSAASPTDRVNGNYERGSPETPLVNGINGTAH